MTRARVSRAAAIMALLIGCRSRNAHPSVYEDDATLPELARPEVLIEVDPAQLAAYGLTMQDVQHALLTMHFAVTPGAPGSFVVKTVTAPADVLMIVIKYRDGVAIRLSDVARASLRK